MSEIVMSVAEAVSTILTLSKTERLRVAHEILESVAIEDAESPISEFERHHLDAAIAAANCNPGAGRTWEEIEAELIELENR